jgi:aspartyl-tRNA(Asn)/glutamyl-tRNA(Gln) amidotransferase subunit C
MSIDKKDLEHVLKLAHLDIPESEKEEFLPQLQRTFSFMQAMDALPLDGVEPSAYANNQAQFLREDIPENQADLYMEKNAPSWEQGCFSVPQILSGGES